MDCLRKMQMSRDYQKACEEDMVKTVQRELVEYLKKYPEMESHKENIEAILDSALLENRLEVLRIIMSDNAREVSLTLAKLQKLMFPI
jgi:hypothetical protein